ncbi:MAG: HPr family phosphocarrier protein [Clostridiales bacterium]|nr:HPr family phosphocarrier protein [Clostridiales bacterium]MBS5877230.1 HPr family phosphocarrier protein [Clostridiales bacterium]MDU0938930.1 HPr family phosphocarrier protein [Clostridiales bacterium]MDU1041935.1 HPr family phosphocarrier protein [Clostridiales bacterium]MDU3490679.1 HPr family phosphocarrier protein [Clostridiales bacterium]
MKKTIEITDIERAYKNPVAELVETACRFNSHIALESEGKNINAKSLLGVMAFGLKKGMLVDVNVEGDDHEVAMEGIAKFLCP